MKNILLMMAFALIIIGCGGGGGFSGGLPTMLNDNATATNDNATLIVDNNLTNDNATHTNEAPILEEYIEHYIDQNKVTLFWKEATDSDGKVEGYFVSYRLIDGEWGGEYNTTQANHAFELEYGKSYLFRVQAFDNMNAKSEYIYSEIVIIDLESSQENNTQEEIVQDNPATPPNSNPTAPNIVLVHGLASGGSTWETLAPQIANKVSGSREYVEIGVDIEINSSAECYSGSILGNIESIDFFDIVNIEAQKMACADLVDIDSQKKFRDKTYRTQAKDYIFGLDKGQFEIASILWRLQNNNNATDSEADKIEQFSNHRVFTINFSNNNQLSFDAKGYQLAKVIEDIANITGVNEFILVGHSMGGLASRAYIQNENAEQNIIVRQLITLNTPHLGGIMAGTYIPSAMNAGVNLASDSLEYRRLNDTKNIGNHYQDIDVYHLGYNDGLNFSNQYYSDGDGNVYIGSQMGLDALDPYRVIFSPVVSPKINQYDLEVTTPSKATSTTLGTVDEVIQITNYTEDTTTTTTNGHTGVLKDTIYLNYILSILAIE